MKNLILKFIYFVLASYARKVIVKHHPFVIGITGSVGKTSTKEAIYQVLVDEFKENVRKTAGNLNAEIGIPLTILGYANTPNKFAWPFFLIAAYFKTWAKSYPKYLVLEMGVEHKGDIRYFGSIVEPNIGVITSTAPVHLVNFKNAVELAEEKISLLDEVSRPGKIIINIDDEGLAKLQDERIISVGIDSKNVDFKAESISFDLEGTNYRIVTAGQNIMIKSGLIGRQFIYSQLIAFAIGAHLGIQSLKIKKSLEKLSPVNGRMKLIDGRNDIKIIDDTYNANPSSVKAALNAISSIKYPKRKVAILGNMNELGSYEKEAHFEIGAYAKERVDLAIFVGPNAEKMAEGYRDKKALLMFKKRDDLIKSVDSILQPGDLVLIKASQNKNYFEEVTKHLMEHPEKAGDLLVRQSKFWLKKKNTY